MEYLATLPVVELLGVTDWKRDSGWKAISAAIADILKGAVDLCAPWLLRQGLVPEYLATLSMVELLGVLATLSMVELLGVTDRRRDPG